jgi:ethanolamine utilization cobalamin adenosyltransferase
MKEGALLSVITETYLRSIIKEQDIHTIQVKKGDIITPSARQYMKEKGIELTDQTINETKDRQVKENHYKDFQPIKSEFQPKYVSNYDGGLYENKPEYMTHIKGNRLVFKDDQRIEFRGRLDSLESSILEIQLQITTTEVVSHLDEILTVIRKVLRAEVLEEPYNIERLLGLDEAELREHSHHPKKYYGVEHFLPDYSMGKELVLLNKLRTEVREVEVIAMKAFRKNHEVEREDILRVLNRLSSATYILMCRVRGQYYKK